MIQKKTAQTNGSRPARSSDRTERKRAEERAQLYAEIVNSMQVGVNVWHLEDPDDLGSLRLVLSNPAAAQFTGVPREDVLFKTMAESYPAALATGIPAAFAEVIRSGQESDLGEVSYGDERAREGVFVVKAFPLLNNCVGVAFENITERKQAEETLRETRDYLEKLIDYANAPIIVWDPDFTITRFNHAFERLTGRPAGEAVGQRLEVLFPEAERAASMEQIARTLRGEFWELIEISILHQNGEVRRVLWNSANIAGPDGRTVVATIAQGTDITERKQAEEALRDAKESAEGLLAAMQDGLSVLDSRGVHVHVNPALCEMTGFSREELIGAGPPHPYWPPEEAEEIERAFQKTLRGHFRDFELTFMRKDGERFPVIVSPSWTKDEQGSVVHYFATVKDITERKRSEEALRESEERLRKLSDATFEGIVIHRKGTILDANQALATMFGYELSEVIGMHALDFAAPESRDLLLRNIVSGYQEPFEGTGLKKDGTTFPVEVCGRPIPYQGKVVTVAAVRDLTDRKRAEEALQKARVELEDRVERQMGTGNSYGLTFRELTVLHLVAAGKADKEIASQLGITTLTASKHLANILNKMGAASRTEAGVRALREGLLD